MLNPCSYPLKLVGFLSLFDPCGRLGRPGPLSRPLRAPSRHTVPSAAVRRPPPWPPGTPPTSRPWRTRAGWRWRAGRGCPGLGGAHGDAPVDLGEVRVRADLLAPGVRPARSRRRGRGRRRPARARAPRGRGRCRRPSPGGTSRRGATGCPSWPGASRGRASLTRSRAGRAPPWSWRRPPSRRARPVHRPGAGDHDAGQGPPDVALPREVAEVPGGRRRRARGTSTPRSRGPRASRGRRPRRRRPSGCVLSS